MNATWTGAVVATVAAVVSCQASEVLPEHRYLALTDAHARIVRAKDESAAKRIGEWPLAVKAVRIPADWPRETNVVYVTDIYWAPYGEVRGLDPKARFTVPSTLCSDPALPLSAWGRMPTHNVTVLCASGDRGAPPPKFFLDRGFRVRLDGKDIPVKTTPSLGAEIALELTPTPENPRNSEGDFVRLKDGTLLFAWSRFYQAGKHENGSWDNGGADIACRRSMDGGRTWSAKDEILLRNTAMNLMSVSFLRLADGRIALFYIEKESAAVYKAMMRTSADEAKTWSDAVEVTACLPPGMYVVNNARVIQLGSGRLLVPVAWHPPKPKGGNQSAAKLFCVRSDDGGRTWAAGAMSEVFDAAGNRIVSQEPGVIELKDGRVMMWTRTNGGAQYAGYSSDGGETWSAFGPTDLKGPLSPATIKRLKTGELIAVWNDHRGHPERGRIRAPLSIALSRDEGRTWAASVTLEENLTDFFCYTALIESGDGLLLAYCTKRERNLDTLRLTYLPRTKVDPPGREPLTEFVARDLTRLLGAEAGKITLRTDATLPAQGWRLKSAADGSLVISGRDALGIANGAYNFLEKYAGVNWFAPDTECVPDLANWKLPTGLDETRQPAFSQREMFVGKDFMDGTWRLRNRSTNRARFVGYVGGSPAVCHTFRRYAKAMGRENICTSDPKTREKVAELMCGYIEADRAKLRQEGRPDYCVPLVYDLSQNDGGSGGCQCPECRKLVEAAGSYSGPNIDFVSDVARRVAKRHPDVQVQTFAYSYTQNPPTNDLVAADNVNVRYCCSWVFDPLLPGTPQGDKLVRWTKHAKRFGIWTYGRTYRGVLFPFVRKRADLAEELRFCRGLGVERYYCENDAPLSRSFAMLQHWLYLKLTEDPSRDPFALSKAFLAGYYGAAAAPVGRYLDYLERRQKTGVGCLDTPQRQHLDREFFEKVNAWLDEAERLVKDDPRSLRHVHWERVVVDRSMYDVIGDLMKQGYVYDAAKVAARFAANAREQIEFWSELNVPARKDQKAKRLKDIEIESDLYAHYPIPLPPEFKGKDVETLEWNKIAPASAKLVKDADAAAGTAFTHPTFGGRFPFQVGFRNAISKEKSVLSFNSQDDVPQDEKYHLHKIGRATILTPLYLHYGAQRLRAYLTTLGIVPEERDIWLSIKFQGPTFVKGSTKEDAILIDRAFEVK